jgi:CubicO group peptidase (beta-lactamase class C family)
MAIKEWIGGLLGQRMEGEMNALVKAYTDQGKFSGAVLVAKGGEVILSKGYGIANRESNALNTPQTVFRIGSMTKSFTAIAIMQLAEGGWLSVDDTLSKHIPDFPNGQCITLAQLLSNTSGIPDYIITPEYQQIAQQHVTPDALTALFRDKALQFEPGADFGYSNSGWVLLGMVAEKITGQSFGELIREQIFKAAGMAHSGYEWEQPVIKQRAPGYIDTGAGINQADFIDESTMHAAGGLYSTAEDLYRWAQVLASGALLHPDTLKRMTVPVYPQYGYGWELYSLHNHAVVGHSGGLPGYVSNFARFPADDAVIIILSNLGSAAVPQMTDALAAILFGATYQLPTAHTFIQVDPAVLVDYVGDYNVTYFGRTSVLKFRLENEKFVMNVTGLPQATLSAISDTTFYARSKGDIEMTFVRSADGRVDSIDMNWAGHQQTATRQA